MVSTRCTPNHASWTQPDFNAIVTRILSGDQDAERELCDILTRGMRLVIARKLNYGPDVDDVLNDVLVTTITNIRNGMLEDPSRLLGYVHAITNHKANHCIAMRMRSRSDVSIGDVPVLDRRKSPEDLILDEERSQIVRATLDLLSSRQRDILTRFYVDEQPASQICAEMNLNETQFRLLKSRAKQRFGDIGRRKIAWVGLNRLAHRAAA